MSTERLSDKGLTCDKINEQKRKEQFLLFFFDSLRRDSFEAFPGIFQSDTILESNKFEIGFFHTRMLHDAIYFKTYL